MGGGRGTDCEKKEASPLPTPSLRPGKTPEGETEPSAEFVFPGNKVARRNDKDLGSDTPRFKSRLCFFLTVTLSW